MKTFSESTRLVNLSIADLAEWETASGSICVSPREIAQKFPYIKEWVTETVLRLADSEINIETAISALKKADASYTEILICRAWLETAASNLEANVLSEQTRSDFLEFVLYSSDLVLNG